MVVSKNLTHFCNPIRLVLHQHLNSLLAYPGITMASADIALVCGLKFQEGCQDRLRVNLDAVEALA